HEFHETTRIQFFTASASLPQFSHARIDSSASRVNSRVFSHDDQPRRGPSSTPVFNWHAGTSSFLRTNCTSKSYSCPTKRRTNCVSGRQASPEGRKLRNCSISSGPSRKRNLDWRSQILAPQIVLTPSSLFRAPSTVIFSFPSRT